jgi:hypothetical protein
MGAIVLKGKKVHIDYETCVECGVCLRSGICPEGAIKQVEEIPYPRIIRAFFSDPLQTHKITGLGGRGTEEMKTNDITDHFVRGKIGFCIELGRPGVGAYMKDIDKVLKKVSSMGVEFPEYNPLIPLMVDRNNGALRAEILNEKVMSAIIELIVPEEEAFSFIDEMIRFFNTKMETVVTFNMIVRADEDGKCPILEKLREHGLSPYPNGKVNIGMALVS